MSDSNLTTLGFVEEVTFGTTPASALQLLRRTGGGLTFNKPFVVSDEIRADLRAGQPVQTGLTAQGSVNVEWSYGTLDTLLEGMLFEAWATNVLHDGTTAKSYTFVDRFPSLTPAQYLAYKASRINEITMELALGAIVKGSVGIMSASPSITQTQPGSGTTAETTTKPFNCVNMVTGLKWNSSPLSRVTGVSLTMSRALRFQQQVGTLAPWGIGYGRLLVKGSITQYFVSDYLMDAYFADTQAPLEFTLDDGDSQIKVELPQIKFMGDLNVENPGPDDDRLATCNFEAWADVGDEALIKFTRTP